MKLSNKKFRTLVAATIGAVSIGAVSSVSFAASEGVHVDQVGYLTDYSKVAMVSLPNCGDDFSVVDTATGKTVFTGKLTAPEFDASSAQNIRRADFSSVNDMIHVEKLAVLTEG